MSTSGKGSFVIRELMQSATSRFGSPWLPLCSPQPHLHVVMLRHLQRGLPLARRTLITSPPSSLACRGQLLERSPQWGHPRGFQSSSILGTTSRPPQPPALSKLPDPDKKAQAHDLAEVRKWVEDFKSAGFEVLRDAKGVVVTFSRSSGPGGQVSPCSHLQVITFRADLVSFVVVECE